MTKRQFGNLRRLPSRRWQAFYRYAEQRYNAPYTFETKLDAETWLVDERRLIASGAWTPPRARAEASRAPQAQGITLDDYAGAWLTHRTLKPRTREHYRKIFTEHLEPTFGPLPLDSITPALVRVWHAGMDGSTPTIRAHAYSLLRTILATAVSDGDLVANPCHIRGAGNTKRVHQIEPLTLAQLGILVDRMPGRYKAMTLLAAWCGLRFGELTELRRKDVDLANGIVKVRRGVTRVGGECVVGTPKSDAGIRDVSVPPHLLPMLTDHLDGNLSKSREGLLFPSAGDPTKHLAPASLYRVFYPAREAAGRPDLRWHDLRHTGAVLAAQTGATLAELMDRLGHSTPQAALRYQHAAKGRDAQIAAALSRIAEGVV